MTGMLKENSLKGKCIVVTGGGTGLGRSMTKYFMELGANAVITSRKVDVIGENSRRTSQGNGWNYSRTRRRRQEI